MGSSDKKEKGTGGGDGKAAVSSSSAKVASGSNLAKPVPKGGSGISEEILTQVAQQKYDAQEEKLREVAKCTMVLLRDYHKIGAPDTTKKINEIRKTLLKYDLQYLRVSE